MADHRMGTGGPARGSLAVRCLMTVVVISCCGCSQKDPRSHVVPTVHAEGTLTYHGQPLAFHEVKFLPEDDRPAVGITDEDGHFVLGTNKPGDGAISGTHRVAVTYVGNPDDDSASKGLVTGYVPPTPPPVKIDPKYGKVETSDLSLEIPPEGTTELIVDLQ